MKRVVVFDSSSDIARLVASFANLSLKLTAKILDLPRRVFSDLCQRRLTHFSTLFGG